MSNDEFVAMPDTNDLHKIAKLGQEFVAVNREIIERKKELEIIEKRFKDLSETELPDAMLSVNLAEFKLTTGYRIVIEPIFSVRLPKGNVNAADEWLDNNGHGGMIKHVIQVELPKDLSNEAKYGLKRGLKELGFSYEELKTVHWATIQAWANEMKKEGELIPEEIFNVFVGNRTIISE